MREDGGDQQSKQRIKAVAKLPPLPAGVDLVTVEPLEPLGSVRDALVWKEENIRRWIDQGRETAKNISIPNCFWR